MARHREINVFSVSFLDLLSGALGAVIILFIIVPHSKTKDKTPEEKTAKSQPQTAIPDTTPVPAAPTPDVAPKDTAAMEEELKKLKNDKNKLMGENQKLNQQIVNLSTSDKTYGLPVDVGFKFKGKKIVFIIDVSGSMYKEDRIGQVKAGLKMLITSMSTDFYVDIIQFPDGLNYNFRPLWSYLQMIGPDNKKAIYNFLLNLKPFGATPTRNALTYVLKRYNGLTDIVLLSDGAPTIEASDRPDDIYSILEEVKRLNTTGIQINTIGVGSDFLHDTQNDKYVFLHHLAQEHQGFFVAF